MGPDRSETLCFRVGNEVAPVEFEPSLARELASALDIGPGGERELTRDDIHRLDTVHDQVEDDALRKDVAALRREVQLAGRVVMFWR